MGTEIQATQACERKHAKSLSIVFRARCLDGSDDHLSNHAVTWSFSCRVAFIKQITLFISVVLWSHWKGACYVFKSTN